MPAKTGKLTFLITAGGTREYIDPVRFISNASTGMMGYALAQAAIEAGHKVTLITAPTALIAPKGVKVVNVETSEQMFEAVKANFARCDVLVMAAAVSDYTPVKVSKTKIKKTNAPLTIKLKPTTDILKWAGQHKKTQLLIGFALEDKNILTRARGKLKSKNADMIIANTPAAIGSAKSQITIISKTGAIIELPKASKNMLAGKIVKVITQL